MDFLRTYFDKILLASILTILVIILEHAVHSAGTDFSTINWLEQTAGQVLAALLALMVGDRLKQKGGNDEKTSNP